MRKRLCATGWILTTGLLLGVAAAQTPNPLRALHFRFVGPQGNRDIAVASVPGNPLVDYFGAASGGLWKTTNGGVTFHAMFDHEDVSAVGAIAVAASAPNIVWVGTGESSIIRQATSPGDGMYKSTDSGLHWQHMGLEQTGHIAGIAINPHNADIVYACAVGQGYRNNRERGVYRTEDGGRSWTQVLQVNDETGCSGISMDAHDPDTLFAGMWQLSIRPWDEDSGGAGSGVYVTHDGGTRWERLSGHGLPPLGADIGKVAVRVAPSDSRRVYVLMQESPAPGFYRSNDYGATWQLMNRNNRMTGRAPYFTNFQVSPGDEDLVYFVAQYWSVSRDGGKTFATDVGRAGGDLHDVWIDPRNPKRILVADDSGGGISLDGGETWERVKLPIAQMYHVYTDSRIPYDVLGNRQDDDGEEGPSRSLFSAGYGGAAGGAISSAEWHGYAGCESGFGVPDPVNPDILWTGCYNGDLTRVDMKTGQARNVSVWPEDSYGGGPGEVRDRWNWTFPIAISARDGNKVFVGSQYVYATVNAGQSWTRISPDLTRNDKSREGSSGGVAGDNLMTFTSETLSNISLSPVQAGVIWVGSYDGEVSVTQDGGKTWSNVTQNIPGLPPWGEITRIEPSHFAAGTAYLSDDLMMMGDYNPYVYKTTDFGRTWTSIAGDLPHGLFSYVHVVREDPVRQGMLYAGTENCIYFTLDDGAHWTRLKNNMPAAPMYWLTIEPRFSDLVVGTYGRGIWIVDDITPLRSWDRVVAAGAVHLFKPRAAYRFRRSVLVPQSGPNDPVAGQNPPYGADLNYYLPAAARSVSLSIRGSDGQVIRSVKGTTHAGLNRVWWNLRYPSPTAVHLLTAPPDMPWVTMGPQGWRALVAWGGNAGSPRVVPGRFQVQLSVDGKVAGTQPLTVLKDPQASGTENSMAAQLKFALRMQSEVSEAAAMINGVESTRRQLEEAASVLAHRPGAAAAAQAEQALEARYVALEGKLYDTHLSSQSIEESFITPVQLYAKLCTLAADFNGTGRYGGGADLGPTEQALAVNRELVAQMDQIRADLGALNRNEGAAFNGQLHSLGLGLGIQFASLPAAKR
ncbi:MAG: WD40/YVTN/BNR-like repeat-containing protein [Terriglobales bacterium]